MPRCFIAFPVSGEAKREIERVAEEIRRREFRAPLKFAESGDVHITVEFLGELNHEQIKTVREILARVTVNYSPFDFKLDHFDAFPDFANPRVLVVRAEDESNLGTALQAELHEELEKAGLIFNNGRAWKPHLTVARVKDEWSGAHDYRRLAVEKISWTVDRVILFESILKSIGPEYSILGEYKLGIK